MRIKITESIVILIPLILVTTEPVTAWFAEWANYKKPALAPNEKNVVFECCRNFEEPQCEDSLKENGKSLYIVDKNGQNLTRLTIAKGKEPVWLSNNEIGVESGGRHWKIALDKLEVKEMTAPLEITPKAKGKKFEVYVTDNKFNPQTYDVSEIWAKEIQTSKSWKIKEAWKNW
jgi:hypothetical protein